MARKAASERTHVTLDDPVERDTAQNDPELFLRQHPFPLIIDECQLAPGLFRSLKRALDEWRKSSAAKHEAAVWLSGSNQMLVDKGLQESLAGRVSIRALHPLSLLELAKAGIPLTPEVIFMQGGWPELHANQALRTQAYVNDYLSTAVEKDVALFQGISQVERFRTVLRLLAGRTGNLLNASDLARDAGISPTTATSWIDGLSRLKIITKLEPFHSNASKRLIKSPKVYFADVSLASRLSGWAEVSPLMVSPQSGALFENVIVQELIRYSDNMALDWRFSFFRTRDGEEIDVIIEGGNGKRVAIEAKLGGGDALRATLGGEGIKLLGAIPLVLVGLTTRTRQWRHGVHSAALEEIAPVVHGLL